MADISNITAYGDQPIVTWDDGVRIPLLRRGSLWIPSRKHPDSGTPTPFPPSGGGSAVVTAQMIQAGCAAGGYSAPTSHSQGGYQGVADIYNAAIAKSHAPTTKKQVACMVGEDIQETGGFYYWVEAGGPFSYDPYRGRGYTQLTWSDNYKSFGNWCVKYKIISDPSHFVSTPDDVATLPYVALTSIWEFDQTYSGKTLWQIADASSSPWTRVSRAINTGNPDSSFPANGESLRGHIIDAVLAVTPDPTVAGGSAGQIGDDYPYSNSPIGAVDPWNFYYRECTSFACWRVRSRTKASSFTNSYLTHWGNGGEWLGAAQSAGITTSSTPRPGDIACRTSNPPGHVAWVSTVNGNNFTVEEYNHNWSNGFGHVYGTRSCIVGGSGSNSFQGYIRFSLK